MTSLLEKLLGRKPEEAEQDGEFQYADAIVDDAIAAAKVTADAVKIDGEVRYVDMGRLDLELHRPPSAPNYWTTSTIDVWPGRFYPMSAPQSDRCPWCGSKSKNDERGNCAACGGPR